MKVAVPDVGGVKSRLGAKAGPLPVWAWSLAIVGVGLLALMLKPKARGDVSPAETSQGEIPYGQQVPIEPAAVVRNTLPAVPARNDDATSGTNNGGGSGSNGDASTPPPSHDVTHPSHPPGPCVQGGPVPHCPRGQHAIWDSSLCKYVCRPAHSTMTTASHA